MSDHVVPQRTVLNGADMQRALTRISHEILESTRGAHDVVLLGIPTRGVLLAERIGRTLATLTPAPVPVGVLDVTAHRDDLADRPELVPGVSRLPEGGLDDRTVVLVDDVLYSGRTVRAALDAITAAGRPRAVRLAVLVDRGHRELPIRADFVGKNLPTSAEERINVNLAELDGEDSVAIAQVGAPQLEGRVTA